ncbi:MAG: penicillin-binding protein 2 [Sphaerochaetaceae bacterium]|nr:penicillin-binding protein 2 [Sphaerochaetaceae bacterium]
MDSTKKNRFFSITLKIITALFIIIIARLFFLMIVSSDKSKEYDDPNVASAVVRGNILDTNDKILAIEVPYYSCSLRVDKISNLEEIAQLISPYLDMEESEIVEIANRYQLQALIKDRIDDDKVEPLQNKIKELNLQNIGKVEKKEGRDYPYTFHAAQSIGFVGSDNEGLEGIEYTMNDYLSPSPQLNEEITYGDDVKLTLDMDIQYLVDLEVQNINRDFDPESIVGIVLDAKTGDILAMTSYPWYDLNSFKESSADEKQNKVISMLYEPGSVFKIFSLALLLDLDQADFETPFICDGTFSFNEDGKEITIKCTHEHGTVTPQLMLKYSCNGAISSWALQSDSDDYYEKLNQLGFNSKIDLPLNGVARSRIADPSTWSVRSKPTISFGQEMSTTAINLVSAATALANDGIILKPHIVKSIVDSDSNVVKEREIERSDPIFDVATADEVLEGMELATQEGGTATKTAIEGLRVGSKTGTAQLYNSETKSYEDGGVLASTLSIVPLEDPKYIIYFAAKAPTKGSIWGSNIAGPAVHGILEGLVSQNKLTIKKQ